MRTRFMQFMMICLGMLLTLAACAGLQQQVTVVPANGEKVIMMEADSFKFTPNNIRANQGDEIVIKLVSTSDAGHNFTIEDPQGHVIKSADLPSRQTVEIKINLQQAGEYTFYCDKPLHSSFGMKGRIEAVKR